MNIEVRSADTKDLKPLLISVADLQRLCSIGKTEAFAILRERKLRSCLRGRKRLVYLEDVERLVAEALASGSL